MKKLLYTLMCCCTLISCTDLEPERYDAINPGFFPKTEKDAEALITGGVYAPFRCDNYSGIFNVATGVQIIGDMSTDLAVCCWVNDAWIPLSQLDTQSPVFDNKLHQLCQISGDNDIDA